MKRTVWQLGATAALSLSLATPGVALAEEAASGSATAGGSIALAETPAPTGGGSSSGAMTLPAQQQPEASSGGTPTAAPGGADHNQFVGTFAVGYLGYRTMQVGSQGGPAGVNAPVVGIRYWLDEMMGIDAGLGFAMTSGSQEASAPGAPTVKTEDPSTTTFILHAGLPLALANSGHFSFQVVPEANIGFASYKQERTGAQEITGSGFHLDIGARAGAEVHFGFIGIPQLSLQGSIGLALASDSWSTEDKETQDKVEGSRFGLATAEGPSPWYIFTNNIAALYYF
ncbi:MAG: hypothetical protein FJ104_17410 [Deltaproteobacteria bacterium]|nr:hypothetical protein [Deltaproteobacteria bacterium]